MTTHIGKIVDDDLNQVFITGACLESLSVSKVGAQGWDL